MDFSRSKIILKKITALHDSAEAFNGRMSKMEKDLMLHYLREMYEMIAIDPETLEEESKVEEHFQRNEFKKKANVPVEPEDQKAPQIQEHPETNVEEKVSGQDLRIEKRQLVSEVTTNGYDANQEVAETPRIPAQSEEKSALLELFQSESGPQTSRFSQLPIADIAKSMGINDRILTINELFGGDQSAFNDCTHKLNGMSTFEEAKTYLLNGPAQANNWDNPIKQGKALVFIQLVKRRYL